MIIGIYAIHFGDIRAMLLSKNSSLLIVRFTYSMPFCFIMGINLTMLWEYNGIYKGIIHE